MEEIHKNSKLKARCSKGKFELKCNELNETAINKSKNRC